MTGLLDRYAARKRKRQKEVEREAERAEGYVCPPMNGGSKIQTTMIPASPEMGSNDQRAWRTLLVKSQGRKLQFLLHYKWSILPNGRKAVRVQLSSL